jgi:cytochrome c peroxidase
MPILRAAGASVALMLLATLPGALADEALVEQGRRLFFGETFAGNGRTCGSCHPADNNYTIDPGYIARLPANDPLLTGDFLDRPLLLRRLGLVVVHADGFERPSVLRAVPTLLGLARSLAPEPGAIGSRRASLGWSGDGVPDGGVLRDFATGAVREHLARSSARKEGTDFRLPSADELRALEAFMRSLGRKASDELELGNFVGVTFRSPLVERGRELFNNEVSGPCALCHRNATALDEGGFNGMLDIGVQRRRATPALRLDPTIPRDGGFGPCTADLGLANRHAGCGDGRFNTPSLIEAADTAPLFHDHSAATIEDAVRFYTTRTFADSPEGQALPIIRLEPRDVTAIAALLRTLNAIENLRSANAFLRRALGQPNAAARPLLRLAGADTADAIAVLTGGPERLYPDATTLILAARRLERVAQALSSVTVRDYLLRLAIDLELRAGAMMLAP